MEFFFEHQLDIEYNLLLVVGQYVCGLGKGQSSINRRKKNNHTYMVLVPAKKILNFDIDEILYTGKVREN